MTGGCAPRIERTGGFTDRGEEAYFARLACACGATGEWRVGYFGADEDLNEHRRTGPQRLEQQPLF
ncbi:hypothetical protein [Nocardiopsis halophila]|uniref:hypothetical protein n=1 Tax=Nocardiopsis halophila TaxID=141692 RepID=UPI00034ADD28|nr:hypothetical protein [Nocardiopsis halophila]